MAHGVYRSLKGVDMKSAIIGVLCFLVGVGGAAVAQRIPGGSATLDWEIEPGSTVVNGSFATQGAQVCVSGSARNCRSRVLTCTSATTATLDGVAIGSLPTALAAFCDGIFGAAPSFTSRRTAMLNAAGVKALLVGP
jgi:hypothetical protein